MMSAVPCGSNEFLWRRLVTQRHLRKGGAGLAALGLHLPASRFTVLAQEATPGGAGEREVLVQGQHWSPVINGSYVSPLVEIYGDVEIGQRSFIAGNTLLYAGEGVRIHLGHENNCQDNAYLFARRTNLAFGDMVSIAHQAVVENSIVGDFAQIGDGNVIHGPVSIGDNFVSEDDCVIFQATVENNVTVRAGATVAGDFVLREGSIVPEGAVVTSQEEADALPIR